MQISDGGGYGGTAWGSTDVRFMWSAIVNQETDPHFDVVGGWRKTADLTLAHLAQVRMYRDDLASVWPPSKSAASAAYIARLDKLIADLQTTHDAAAANYTAFSTVTLTLSMARQKLKPILEQYEANEQLNQDWQTKQDAVTAKGPASASPGRSWSRQVPPVSAARQEELNNQARTIMYDLSSTLLSGQAALIKPRPYNPSGDYADDKISNQSRVDPGSGFSVPPTVPPPGKHGGTSFGPSQNLEFSSSVTPVQPTTNTTTGPGLVGIGSGPTPVLGGAVTAPIQPLPHPGPSLATGPTTPPISSAVIPAIIFPSGGTKPTYPYAGSRPNSTKIPPINSVHPGIGSVIDSRATTPSGGVIGAQPGSSMIGQMSAGGGQSARTGRAARVNPVGGVIGQPGGSLIRGTASISPTSNNSSVPATNRGGRGHRQRDDGTGSVDWSPEDPWVTEKGVDPVVLPPEDPGPIDPGPAIGYSR